MSALQKNDLLHGKTEEGRHARIDQSVEINNCYQAKMLAKVLCTYLERVYGVRHFLPFNRCERRKSRRKHNNFLELEGVKDFKGKGEQNGRR